MMLKARFVFSLLFITLTVATISLAQQPASSGDAAITASEPAQVPRLIRFSGSVMVPEARTAGITFALYKDQTGGAPLWQEVQNVAVDATGRYTALLGADSADGVPAELFATNEARWLGVQEEQDPEQPRVLLVSVPYALKAGDAETLGGKPLSAFVMAQPEATAASPATSSTKASSTNSAKLTPRFGVNPNSLMNPSPSANGTTNVVAKFDAGSNLINSSIFDNGMVGIGTATPVFNLDVVGGIETQAAQFPQFNFKQTGGGGAVAQEWRFQINPEGSYRIYDMTGGTIPRFVLTKAGMVGIGTASPAFTLDVVGGMQAQSPQFPQINFKQTGASGVTPQEWRYQINPDGSYRIYDMTGGVIPRFVLTQAGNIGLGTSSPGQKLEVAGNLRISGPGNALIFPDGSVMSSAASGVGGGTITGITTSSTSGLSGGTNSGNVNLSLTSCSAGQLLKSNGGTSWACASDQVGAGVTSITAGTGLTGGTITASGTIALDTTFADGRYVQAGGSNTFTGANTLQGETTIGAGGLAHDGGGLKHVRRVFGGIPAGAFGTGSFDWDTPFGDASYTVICNFLDEGSGDGLRVLRIQSRTASSVTVVFSNDDVSIPFRSGTLHCIAIHD